MTVPSFHVEAKLHAFRKTQDGVVVSFVVSPIDIPKQLALDPLGTRYMLALAAIGDDEQPVAPPPEPQRTDTHRSERAKDTYRQSSAAEQAVVRAALLPKDERFRAWVAERPGYRTRLSIGDVASEPIATEYIRQRCCSGKSRSLIAEVPEYLDRFLAMETEFKIDIGELAEPR